MADHKISPDQVRADGSHGPYWRVFASLVVLTLVEYLFSLFGSSRMPLSFVALASGLTLLATVYAFLVVWFFMHLKYEGRWIYLMLVPVCLLTVVVIAGLTPDIAYHQGGFFQSTAVADR
jgi:cytochrome c oxidase subunit 4